MKKIGIVLMIGMLFIIFTQGMAEEAKISSSVNTGQKAIDFTLRDLKGKEVNLFKDFANKKVIILVFSTTWCPYCISEIPNLKNVYKNYKNRGLEVIHIDVSETPDRVSSFVDKYKIPYRVLLDEKGKVAQIYKVVGVPTTFILDKNKIIHTRHSGGGQDYDTKVRELGIK